jgi:hypothetical protein
MIILDSIWTLLSITKVACIKSHVPLLECRLVAVIILISHIVIGVDGTVLLVLRWWLNIASCSPLLSLWILEGESSLGSAMVVLLSSCHLSLGKVVNSPVSGRYSLGTPWHLILNLDWRWTYTLPWNVSCALVDSIEACRHISCWVCRSKVLLSWCLCWLREYLWFV